MEGANGVAKRLLLIAHAPSPNTARLRDAVAQGARHPDIDGVDIAVQTPFDTVPQDIIGVGAVILGTTENLGYMSGALKDFFDRCYYPCQDTAQGMPYALYIRAGLDGTGTRRAVESITGGMGWRAVHDPVLCKGDWQDSFVADCTSLGTFMAAGLEGGIF